MTNQYDTRTQATSQTTAKAGLKDPARASELQARVVWAELPRCTIEVGEALDATVSLLIADRHCGSGAWIAASRAACGCTNLLAVAEHAITA